MTTTSIPHNSLECPYNWRLDWPEHITIGCGGTETPTQIAGKWYLYLFDRNEGSHKYFCFNDDLYISDKYFEENIRNL